jgi:dTDP-4-amino-4,6-dideoxygalactose transaminase
MRCQPVLPLAAVFDGRARSPQRPFPLGRRDALLTFSGTAAIYQAFRSLALPTGSVVLCPSYNCGHEIEPLTRLGLTIECYRITADLQIDLEDLERRLNGNVKALLVTHYFGFAQPLAALRALCDRHGVLLVEDCAHSFLSNDAAGTLGRVGNIAIYSMRKTLPIPNGGAVLFNDATRLGPDVLRPPARISTWLKSMDLIGKAALDQFRHSGAWHDAASLVALSPVVVGSRALQRVFPRSSTAHYNPDDEDFRFATEILSWGISPFSLRVLARIDWTRVAARRQENYRFLAGALQGIAGCRVMLPNLPDYTCPLYLPIFVQWSPSDAYHYLARHRIYADVFWEQEHPSVDWRQFPEARELKRHVLALPVHQDIDEEQLEHLAATLRDFANTMVGQGH